MNSEQPELAALIGLDWADEDHAVCMRVAATNEIRTFTVKQQPEKVHDWITRLLKEFGGSKIGIAVESSRGGLVYALMQYPFLILYPINPKTLAKYRESTCVSGAKDDPSDAALLMDFMYRHRDSLPAAGLGSHSHSTCHFCSHGWFNEGRTGRGS